MSGKKKVQKRCVLTCPEFSLKTLTTYLNHKCVQNILKYLPYFRAVIVYHFSYEQKPLSAGGTLLNGPAIS